MFLPKHTIGNYFVILLLLLVGNCNAANTELAQSEGKACPGCIAGGCNTQPFMFSFPIVQIIVGGIVGVIWGAIFLTLYIYYSNGGQGLSSGPFAGLGVNNRNSSRIDTLPLSNDQIQWSYPYPMYNNDNQNPDATVYLPAPVPQQEEPMPNVYFENNNNNLDRKVYNRLEYKPKKPNISNF